MVVADPDGDPLGQQPTGQVPGLQVGMMQTNEKI